jgi:hypothetical protein
MAFASSGGSAKFTLAILAKGNPISTLLVPPSMLTFTMIMSRERLMVELL